MKALLKKVYDTCLAGLLLILPLLVFFALGQKAWKAITSLGTKLAALVGLHHPTAGTIASSISILIFLYIAGLLVRFTWIVALRTWLDRQLESYIPGYAAYRKTVEKKVKPEAEAEPILPYSSCLVQSNGGWQPAFLVEQQETGQCLVFLPQVPNTEAGTLLLLPAGLVRVLADYPANKLQKQLKSMGKGMLAELVGKENQFAPSRTLEVETLRPST